MDNQDYSYDLLYPYEQTIDKLKAENKRLKERIKEQRKEIESLKKPYNPTEGYSTKTYRAVGRVDTKAWYTDVSQLSQWREDHK